MSDPVPVSRPLDPPGYETEGRPPTSSNWFGKLSSIVFIFFCFELGLFLLIYPWISAWSDNYFAWAVPQAFQKSWNVAWNNAYFRGAVSGLGLANIWIAVAEIFRLFKRR